MTSRKRQCRCLALAPLENYKKWLILTAWITAEKPSFLVYWPAKAMTKHIAKHRVQAPHLCPFLITLFLQREWLISRLQQTLCRVFLVLFVIQAVTNYINVFETLSGINQLFFHAPQKLAKAPPFQVRQILLFPLCVASSVLIYST